MFLKKNTKRRLLTRPQIKRKYSDKEKTKKASKKRDDNALLLHNKEQPQTATTRIQTRLKTINFFGKVKK